MSNKNFYLFILVLTLLSLNNITTKQQTSFAHQEVTREQLVYVPFITHPESTQKRINDIRFGVSLESYDEKSKISNIESAGAGWIRSDSLTINWLDFEPNSPGQYDPSNLNAGGSRMRNIEQQLLNANARKFKVIQTISGAPIWALPTGNGNCGPILVEHYAAFGEFVAKIVKKYSQPPYNIKYWELFSQPDKYANLGTRARYDCTWVDFKDPLPHYGGRKYGDLLRLVGEKIKQADPEAKLISGSLEMDCAPVWRGDLDEELTKTCVTTKFFIGMLLSGATKYIDFFGIDAHDKFDAFDNVVGHYNNEVNWHNKWNNINTSLTAGPTIIPKAIYLNTIAQQTGGTEMVRPIINMRGALRCKFQNFNWKYEACEPQWDLPNFDLTKAYYVAQVNTAGLANNVALTIWDTTTDNSRNRTELFDNKGDMTFTALRENYAQLDQAQFEQEDKSNKDVKQYRFARPSDQLLVAWGLKDTPVSLALTQTVISITDALGQAISPTQSISITVKPLYIALK